MKALTFIEIWQQCQRSKITYGKVIDYEKIVSQPFRPEMILELFEDFNFGKTAFGLYFSKTQDSTKVWIKFYLEINNGKYTMSKGETVCQLIKPQTLNDFISDCNRAGIELEWKKGVWKC